MENKLDFSIPHNSYRENEELMRGFYVFRKRGFAAAPTDFSIILGANVKDDVFIKNGEATLENRAADYWLYKSCNGILNNVSAPTKTVCDYTTECPIDKVNISTRPILRLDDVEKFLSDKVTHRASDGILEVEFGYYPQQAASKEIQEKLQSILPSYATNNFQCPLDGNKYNMQYYDRRVYDVNMKTETFEECVYNGKRYIKMKTRSTEYYNFNDTISLSNGEKYKTNSYVWIEVQPIKWLLDEETKTLVSDKLLFSNIPYHLSTEENNFEEYKGDFSTTNIKKYMDNYFSKEILQTKDPRKIVDYKLQHLENLREAIRSIKNKPMIFEHENEITIDNILNGKLDDVEFTLDRITGLAIIQNLSKVDEANMPKVREFVKKLGGDFLESFDILWTNDEESRKEYLEEIKNKEFSGKKM